MKIQDIENKIEKHKAELTAIEDAWEEQFGTRDVEEVQEKLKEIAADIEEERKSLNLAIQEAEKQLESISANLF